uniref:Uncharacterized protein n=1 Tax=viral metagenome TaxID=1070528 RepID=A0A6C0C7V7_9ZZZZ
MQTDVIDGLVTLLASKSIVIINMLIETSSINSEMLTIALKKLYAQNCTIRSIDFINEMVNLIEPIDDETSCHLLNNLVVEYYNQPPKKNVVFENCFKKLSVLCSSITISAKWMYIPPDLFFYHISNSDIQFDLESPIIGILYQILRLLGAEIFDNYFRRPYFIISSKKIELYFSRLFLLICNISTMDPPTQTEEELEEKILEILLAAEIQKILTEVDDE